MEPFFSALAEFENFLWSFIGFPAVMLLGLYLSCRSGFVQVRKLPEVIITFFSFFKVKEVKGTVHPLKAFFACIGGCVGIGNVVGICTAVQIGGPGALFWIWMTAIFGSTVKYSEVYLGVRHRVRNPLGGYNGGPMYFLTRAFSYRWIPGIVCLLLCIYGVEVYQFNVITSSITTNFPVNKYAVIAILLALVLFAGSGGVRRVGNISSTVIPLFVVLYVGMGGWVLYQNFSEIPFVFKQVLHSAFDGHAAFGGFLGSTMLMAISQGVRRGCYTADLGVGYASVIHSESSAQVPERQAALVIFDIFLDTFIVCTSSLLMILVTGVWHEPLETGQLVQTALSQYFPYMQYFMPFFLFMLGYSTITAYFCVGLKCAQFLAPRWGKFVYYGYTVLTLTIFSFVESAQAQMVMSVSGGLLLAINCYGIFKLRNELSFDLDHSKELITVPAS